MTTGDKIFIFPETNKNAYVGMIHDAGFHCYVHHDFIEVGSPLHGHMERQEIAKAIKNTAAPSNRTHTIHRGST